VTDAESCDEDKVVGGGEGRLEAEAERGDAGAEA
jgi:hypothetical protein